MSVEKYSFERYLNVRSAYAPGFSPDGKRLSFLTDITGVAEVWSIPIDVHAAIPAWPEQLTFLGERVTGASYSPTADVLLLSADVGGNERTQLYSLSADGSAFIALTTQSQAIYQFGGWSPDGTRITYSSNERDGRYFDVYERTLATGESRRILQHDGTNHPVRYSPDGRYVLVSREESNVRNRLLLLDTMTGDRHALTPEAGEEQALHEFPGWSADRRGLYLLSNRGRQFLSLAWLDLVTTEMTYLRDEPWDAEFLALTRDGTRMALVFNEDGYSRLQLFDVSKGWEARLELPVPALPAGVIYGAKWSEDGKRLAITLYSPDNAPDIWVWDIQEQVLWRATRSALGGIPRESFVEPSMVRYPTFDGRQIPAFLYVPRDGQQHDLPVVINVHGGPEGQSRPEFDPVIQYLVARGYAVLEPNVRGSTGYGYEYQSLDG